MFIVLAIVSIVIPSSNVESLYTVSHYEQQKVFFKALVQFSVNNYRASRCMGCQENRPLDTVKIFLLLPISKPLSRFPK